MDDVLRRLRAAEHEIIVLGSVKRRIKQPDALKKRLLHDRQMTDVVHRGQEIRVIVRLQVRLHVLVADADLVLVAVKEFRIRVFADRVRIFVERVRCKEVIVVGKCNEVALCRLKRLVGVLGNSELLLIFQNADPAVGSRKSVEERRKRGMFTAAVRENKLPVRIGLGFDRIHQLGEIPLRGFIERDHNGEQRRRVEFVGALLCEHALRRQMLFDPVRIDHGFHRRVEQLVVRLFGERHDAVVLEIFDALLCEAGSLIRLK